MMVYVTTQRPVTEIVEVQTDRRVTPAFYYGDIDEKGISDIYWVCCDNSSPSGDLLV
jgi:hypothetical protein